MGWVLSGEGRRPCLFRCRCGTTAPKGRQVRFDPFRFDPETGRLWAGAQEVRLTPKSAAVLTMLVGAARGRGARGRPVVRRVAPRAVERGVRRAQHAPGAALPEPERRPGAGVLQRRPDRGADRAGGAPEAGATGGDRSRLLDALQGLDPARRRDRPGAERRLHPLGEPEALRRPRPCHGRPGRRAQPGPALERELRPGGPGRARGPGQRGPRHRLHPSPGADPDGQGAAGACALGAARGLRGVPRGPLLLESVHGSPPPPTTCSGSTPPRAVTKRRWRPGKRRRSSSMATPWPPS